MRILTLSTFPIEKPRHGGQHRLANIVRLLKQAGHSVQTIGVLGSDHYESSEGFLPYPGSKVLTEYIDNPFLMEDWALGQLFNKNDLFFNSLVENINETPDLILTELPWLFEFACKYKKSIKKTNLIIAYGSENIEHELKYKILKTYMGENVAKAASKKILATELFALEHADVVYAVSENDLLWNSSKTNAQVILAQNGVRELTSTNEGIIEASKITGNKKTALYCASGHPPNITGFFDIFSNGIGCLAPDERLVVAGSAGLSIKHNQLFGKTAGLQNTFIDAGSVSDDCLQGLLNIAHVIVLPITQGGGTNLKTAEALWSGKYVVATKTAMRGFEEFMNSTGVYVCDSPSDFCAAIRDTMQSPPLSLSKTEVKLRQKVLWEETLKELINSVNVYEEKSFVTK